MKKGTVLKSDYVALKLQRLWQSGEEGKRFDNHRKHRRACAGRADGAREGDTTKLQRNGKL